MIVLVLPAKDCLPKMDDDDERRSGVFLPDSDSPTLTRRPPGAAKVECLP
jgi:hypothetical protein